MRKVEKKITDLITSKTNGTADNTTVIYDSRKGVMTVHLHGNLIATILPTSVEITLAGWDTNITRSRLHLVLLAVFPRLKDGTPRFTLGRHKGATRLTNHEGPEDQHTTLSPNMTLIIFRP